MTRPYARWAVAGMLGWVLAAAALAAEVKDLGPGIITNGSYTGRVSALVASPTDPNRYFAAGADGGVWRTVDGGLTWTPLTDFMPTTAMGALALDPTNENIIYAGTGEANFAQHSRYGLGLYKSTDGGDSWTQLGASVFSGRCFSKIVVSPQNPQLVYASITRAGGFPEMAAAKGHPGAAGPVGVFRSADGGVTWQQLTAGLPSLSATDLAMNMSNPSMLYAAIGHIFGDAANGIYKSSDGGDTWTKLGGTNFPTGTLGRISVALAPTQPNRIYTLITNPATASGDNATVRGAYRSDDGGGSWTGLPITNIQSTYGWYLSIIIVDPTNPNIVFMGGLSLRRSTNAGASWQTVTPPHVDMHAIAWDSIGRLLVGDDGGVHNSDSGLYWGTINNNLSLIQFYAGLSTHPTDDNVMIGGTQDNGTNRRDADSRDWYQMFSGDGGWTQLDQTDPLRMFVEYQGSGNLYQAIDGGYGFSFSGDGIATTDRNCFLPAYLIDPHNPQRMLYGTHRVYESTDGGWTWTPISGDLTGGGSASIRTLALAPSNSNIVYAATNDNRVLRSSDGGTTFNVILTDVQAWPRTTRQIFVHPTNPQTVYVSAGAFGTTHVRRSVDGGQNWRVLDGDLPDIPVNTIAADVRGRRPVVYAGVEDGLYRSVDDGATWRRYGDGLPRCPVIDLRLEPGRNRLIIATQGRGAWTVPLAVPGDCNCDGLINFSDIDFFVAGIPNNRAAWEALHVQRYGVTPNCAFEACDANGDGSVNFSDIDPFVALLTP